MEESNRLRQLAKASYEQGKYDEALEHLNRSQERLVYPHPVVQKEIALTLGQLHQYEEAIHYYGISLHLQEDHFTRLNRALAFLGAGRWTEAKADAEQALRAMAMGNTPTASRGTANEILAYAEAKLERHEEALVHADLAVKDAIKAKISANWVQKMTNFVDMVNEVRREKGTSEDIVIFPSLAQMTEGIAWLETGDINRANQLLEQSQKLHQGDSWFIESALAKTQWQLGNQTQGKDHLVKTIMRRDQGSGHAAKQAVLQALENCDLEANSRTTYGTYQWSTCPEDQVNLAIHTSRCRESFTRSRSQSHGTRQIERNNRAIRGSKAEGIRNSGSQPHSGPVADTDAPTNTRANYRAQPANPGSLGAGNQKERRSNHSPDTNDDSSTKFGDTDRACKNQNHTENGDDTQWPVLHIKTITPQPPHGRQYSHKGRGQTEYDRRPGKCQMVRTEVSRRRSQN